MKTTTLKLKTAALIALAAWSTAGFAQGETMMYVMKNGEVVFYSLVSGVDNVTFDKAAPDSTLIVGKNDGSFAGKILLNDIQQLSFSAENLSVKTSGGSEAYAFEDITKLFFGDVNTIGIHNTFARNGLDVFVYLTPEGDFTVESPAAIRSLTLFGIDGKISRVATVETLRATSSREKTLHATSLPASTLPAGIYLLRIETEQGTVVKKAVKPLNK